MDPYCDGSMCCFGDRSSSARHIMRQGLSGSQANVNAGLATDPTDRTVGLPALVRDHSAERATMDADPECGSGIPVPEISAMAADAGNRVGPQTLFTKRLSIRCKRRQSQVKHPTQTPAPSGLCFPAACKRQSPSGNRAMPVVRAWSNTQSVAARVFHGIHGGVGIAEELSRSAAVVGKNGDSDAEGQADSRPPISTGWRRCAQSAAQRRRPPWCGSGHHNDELISTQRRRYRIRERRRACAGRRSRAGCRHRRGERVVELFE